MESCSGTGFHSFSQRKSNGGYETANTTLKKKPINISNHLKQILKKIDMNNYLYTTLTKKRFFHTALDRQP